MTEPFWREGMTQGNELAPQPESSKGATLRYT
jgi:hypothetical protein